ncbi:MAG: TRAP transporter small permease subunit [Aquisalimonadaceae bacterium]
MRNHSSSSGALSVLMRFIRFIDAVSTFAGRTSSWLILVLTLIISFEVVSRYVFGWPHDWVFDTSYMLFGAVLLLSGAYALATDSHVRGDLLYSAFPPRMQASVDLSLYLLFFVPGVIALLVAGYWFAAESWAIRESSSLTPDGPPIYPLKMVIPVAGALLVAQGLAEMIRAGICLVTGTWPDRVLDPKPVDIERLRAEVLGSSSSETRVSP